ncbi:hypothetical protein VTK73DRAFT_3718 [Phialemonium thermophilum]|uniref:Uncharacterized protein n=1 Tax=Phialemonium thermophilum TaxID=223376 RepID=A0ABR3VFS1_9PEZI
MVRSAIQFRNVLRTERSRLLLARGCLETTASRRTGKQLEDVTSLPPRRAVNMRLAPLLAAAFQIGAVVLAQETTPLPPSCPQTQADAAYPATSKLPDPYRKADGTRFATREEWECKRDEIRQRLQRWELGPKPPKPSSVTATLSGRTISIPCSEGGQVRPSPSLSPSGCRPARARAWPRRPSRRSSPSAGPPSPSPPASPPLRTTHGRGKFYDLYGSSHVTGG